MDNNFFSKLTEYGEKYIRDDLDLNQSVASFLYENPKFDGSKNSVSMYLEAYRHLIKGETYKRNINTGLHLYFLKYIQENYPDTVFKNSLKSTRGHLDYRFKSSGQTIKLLEEYMSLNLASKVIDKPTTSNLELKSINFEHQPIQSQLKKFSSQSVIIFFVLFGLSLANFLNIFKVELQSIVNGTLFLILAFYSIVYSIYFIIKK